MKTSGIDAASVDRSSVKSPFPAHHDIGGDPRYACDPVSLADGAPPDDFGRRVDAIRQVLFGKGILNGTDEFRRGIELIPKADYDRYQYYERWLHSLRILLVEKGVVTEAELQ
jgi:nitrile hydratase